MYLALARDFLLKGQWPEYDSYLYSLPHAELHIAHEYLSYLIFHSAWWTSGLAGLIVLKGILLAFLFSLPLSEKPQTQASSPFWIMMWTLAVLAASFRFIERSSQFSDIFTVLLMQWLLGQQNITRSFVVKLTLLFLLWVQLHPGFPIAVLLLMLWAAWSSWQIPGFASKKLLWLLVPVAALAVNPLGIEGAVYPVRFALNEANVFKHHNFEWFPAYSKAFRFTPEVIAFWTLSFCAVFLLWREKKWLSLRGLFTLFSIACAAQPVRFVPWAAFAICLTLKPWAQFTAAKIPVRSVANLLAVLLLALAVKNLALGYQSSSGPRTPGWGLDPEHFPIKTLDILRRQPISGRLYNAHEYGAYLVWMGFSPVFHHGFVTDMGFYARDVVGVFESQQRFLELAKKYDWKMLLVEKAGSYHYFYKILSPLTNWKIVAEDEASYLIYDLPDKAP